MQECSIFGLSKLIETEIMPGSVILVTGAEGTLKSTLVFGLMSDILGNSGQHGLYITLEQSKESHLKNMNSLGLMKKDDLHIFDYRDMRREWRNQEPCLMKTTQEIIEYYQEKYSSMTVFALDSLNALYSFSDNSDPRKGIYDFFSYLREEELISFLIQEAPPLRKAMYSSDCDHPERFLADGTIELGMLEGRSGVKRYIQILKMRATKHAMEKHQLIADGKGLRILGQIYA
jgi:KaiC/GvpD/RAD55 family RecA-like ATPase